MFKTIDLKWSFIKKLELVRQTESAECGVACLAMIAGWNGYKVNLPQLRQKCRVTQHGMSLASLIRCAEALNLSARPLRLELEELNELQLPCILHWNANHFVVLNKVKKKYIEIYDPASGILHLSFEKVSSSFTGIALELLPTHEFTKKDEKQKIRVFDLIGKTIGLKSALTRIFFLSFTLEFLALSGPLLNQVIIDEVLVNSDNDLLTLITISILLLTFMQTFISLAREWAVIAMSVDFNMQWTANVFHHLLHLPVGWYEKRNIGNIAAKFDAINAIQGTLTQSTLQALLDTILVVTTFSMMIIYSWELSLIAIVSAVIYGIIRLLWYKSLRLAEEESWTTSAEENSHFLETLRGITSLKVNNALDRRELSWKNLNIKMRNAHLRQSQLSMSYGLTNSLIGGGVSAAILWFGAKTVMSSEFSIGMLVAFMSYQGRFTSSISSLIDKAFEYKILDVQNERLADIVLTERESTNMSLQIIKSNIYDPLDPVIKVDNLRFSYGNEEPEIFHELSFEVNAKETVALTGPSGCGKTTLIKLLLGLHRPDSGNITIFGINHSTSHFPLTKEKIGVVMQDDYLFAGSIMDNITFFAQEADFNKVIHSANLAEIHQEIEKLPMGYHTLIGEMGSSLSGGQRQRVLLARALYKNPDLLILDEATSNLDVNNEIAISVTIKKLELPVLLIAHRPDTIACADRIIAL